MTGHAYSRRSKPYQINVPIVMPPHCCTDRMHGHFYDNARIRTQDDFINDQETLNGINQDYYIQRQSTKRSKKSETRTRTRTQYA